MYRWWGERLITLLAKSLNADIVSWFFDSGSLDPRELWFKGKIIELSKPGFIFFDKRSYQAEKTKAGLSISAFRMIILKWLRHLALKFAISFKSGVLKDYDVVIFSWDGLWAVRSCRKDAKIVYYCHTPPRYLFDQKQSYLDKVPALIRPFYLLACFIFEILYKRDLRKVSKILTNSKTVQQRIAKYLKRESEIIYPPVDTEFFKPWDLKKDYYFSWARLTEIKRVHVIVEAFMEMPDKKLVISYWKNDPDKIKIAQMVSKYDNIKMVESPDDIELRKLIQESIATIYIPKEEDFWMSPVESMACWVPVIWVDEWWLRESIVDSKTWFLIPKWAWKEDLKNAINKLDLKLSESMKESCIKRAEEFGLDTFSEKIRREVL